LLISLKAGGLGLQLVAANVVFLMDPWWNPSVEQQAIDRCHRIGQKKEVHVYRLTMKVRNSALQWYWTCNSHSHFKIIFL
jgi:SNF2 family DNA or RNA helicase